MANFEIESVKDCVWRDAEHTLFDCMVKYKQFDEEHPSTIVENDKNEHITTIWKNALAGEYGEIKEYEPPAPPKEEPPIDIPITLEDLLKTL